MLSVHDAGQNKKPPAKYENAGDFFCGRGDERLSHYIMLVKRLLR